MVNLITQNISGKQINSSNSVNKTVEESDKSANNSNIQTIHTDSQNKHKLLLPLGLIGSGGLLIYYGFKKPNAVKFIKNMLSDRMAKMEQQVADFYSLSKELVKKGFADVPSHIEAYKQEHCLDINPYISNIKQSDNLGAFIEHYTFAFGAIDQERAKNIRAGACDFDIFKGFLHNIKKNTAAQIDESRDKLNLEFADYAYIPPFKNGGHEEIIEKLQNNITDKVNLEKTNMWDYRNRILNIEISEHAEQMAEAIKTSRELISEGKKSTLDSAFSKIKQLLNLPEDFAPVHSQNFGLENFAKLSPEDLKPQNLPDEISDIFKFGPLKNVLETIDFSKINKSQLREIFLRLTPECSIDDIGILIDRIRLQDVIDKSQGKNNEQLYKPIISKLEFLSNKLADSGKNELIAKVKNTNFENLNEDQKHARFYYIYDIARRLELDSYDKINKFLIQNYPEYTQTSLCRVIHETSLKPDFYFF